MPSFHRIVWFHNQINDNKFPNAKKLSDTFEISLRQAQRDIEYLRDSLNAPLTYSAKERGYTYSCGYSMPVFFLSQNERQLINAIANKYWKISLFGYGEYGVHAKVLTKISQGNRDIENISKEPYIAQIQYLGDRKSTAPLDYFPHRYLENNVVEYSLFDPEIFMSALLASGLTFTIIKPKWLKEYIKTRLTELLKML